MRREFTVLVADQNPKDARLIADAVAALALPVPVQMRSGKEAVLWVGAQACDVCVVDFGLRDLNGLETMLRIHQRKPDLPVILTSGANSEEVAVAAFHAGVADYVPKKRGYAALVADVIHRIEQQTGHERDQDSLNGRQVPPGHRLDLAPQPAPLAAGVTVAEALCQPTYENVLRVIGHELDTCGYRSMNLWQVGDGFYVRIVVPGRRMPELLAFTNQTILALLQQDPAKRGTGERVDSHARLLPTGYEDFLRALGHELDQRKAEAITITEFEGMVAVGGAAIIAHDGAIGLAPFQEFWRPDDVEQLLNRAFRRRGWSHQR